MSNNGAHNVARQTRTSGGSDVIEANGFPVSLISIQNKCYSRSNHYYYMLGGESVVYMESALTCIRFSLFICRSMVHSIALDASKGRVGVPEQKRYPALRHTKRCANKGRP